MPCFPVYSIFLPKATPTLEFSTKYKPAVQETTSDKFLIDFVTKTSRRPDSKALKAKYPSIYSEVLKASESRKVKVAIQSK